MVETSMIVAHAQAWFFMWQDNWTTVITTKVVKKTITTICISTFYHLQGLLVIQH